MQAEELEEGEWCEEELEEGEWFEAPEFSYCHVVYEYQQVQAECSEWTDEELAWLQSGVRKEGDRARYVSMRKTGRRVRASRCVRGRARAAVQEEEKEARPKWRSRRSPLRRYAPTSDPWRSSTVLASVVPSTKDAELWLALEEERCAAAREHERVCRAARKLCETLPDYAELARKESVRLRSTRNEVRQVCAQVVQAGLCRNCVHACVGRPGLGASATLLIW